MHNAPTEGNNLAGTAKWCENVMVVDADYIDKVAFDLIVNFERMIERRIPQADMARWIRIRCRRLRLPCMKPCIAVPSEMQSA